MADLKAMFGKKPQSEGESSEPPVASVAGPSTNGGSPNPPKRNPFSRAPKNESVELPRGDSTEAGDGKESGGDGANPASAGSGDGGVESGGARSADAADQSNGSAGGDSKAKPRLAGIRFGSGSAGAAKDSGVESGGPISSLDDLDQSVDEGLAPVAPRSGFADETPATKPTRDLPEGMDKSTLQFVDLIDGVYEIIHDPELLGNVIRSIMIELKANPQYAKLIRDDDVRTWVRAMRENMGLARIKKVEAKAKRGAGKSKTATKSVDMDMMADLADLGLGDLT